jgi:hypothetical protein
VSIYRYERRVWLALNGKAGIKSLEEILPVNKKKLLEYADYLKASWKETNDILRGNTHILGSRLQDLKAKKNELRRWLD